jgi:vacuolar-type H+-ATPase subunit E/Vma4
MSLERLVEEIRLKAEAEIAREKARLDAERAQVAEERDRRVAALRTEVARQTELDIARERAQRIARAKLDARKKIFGARERRMGRQLEATRQLLTEFTTTDGYAALLKRLYGYAVAELGRQLRVSGRAEDGSALRTLAKGNYAEEPVPILGGLIAETPDGNRRLNLSFDELLRLREDRLRELLAA